MKLGKKESSESEDVEVDSSDEDDTEWEDDDDDFIKGGLKRGPCKDRAAPAKISKSSKP